MKNWFDIIPPRKGQFDEAVFAADLGDVTTGVAAPDYNDPYLIERLRRLLTRVNQKLVQGRGGLVIEIRTPFVGGKTHALVACHFAGDNVQGV